MNEVTKDVLSKEEYKFIHQNENLGENIIYLTLAGLIEQKHNRIQMSMAKLTKSTSAVPLDSQYISSYPFAVSVQAI